MVHESLACRLAAVLAAAVLAAAANVLIADTITKTDGTVLKGRIVQESDRWVVLEITKMGTKVTLPIARSGIRSIHRGPDKPRHATPKPTTAKAQVGPGYYPLPIKGAIGVEVKAEFLTEALKDARRRKPDFVVLLFDSPGGSIEEAGKLINALAAAKDLKIVAYVRKATAAAALVALACPQIYMATDGMIGAPLADRRPPDAAPKAVDAKIRSLWLSQARTAAQLGGHSALIAEGMFDADLELALQIEKGKPLVKAGKGGQVLKEKGTLLTLVGREAVECGLAKSFSREISTLNEVMGLAEWHKVPGTGWSLMTQKGLQNRRDLEAAERKRRREEYMQKIAPDLSRIDERLGEVKAKGKAAEKQKKTLQRQYEDDLKDIEADYRRDKREADRQADNNPELTHEMRRRARSRRDRALDDLVKRSRPKAKKIQDDIRSLLREMKSLQAERRKLLAAAPK